MQKKRSYNASLFLWKKDGKGHARWPHYYMVRCSLLVLPPTQNTKQDYIIIRLFFVFVYLRAYSVIIITTLYKAKIVTKNRYPVQSVKDWHDTYFLLHWSELFNVKVVMIMTTTELIVLLMLILLLTRK